MRGTRCLSRFVLQAVILSAACAVLAQGPPGHDRDSPRHGHEDMPPGQAKKHGDDNRMPPGHARRHGGDDDMPHAQARRHGDDDRMPPGQAKRFNFRDEDRGRFYSHYREDAERWRGRRRPVFVRGQYVPSGYVVRAVPRTYWVGVVPAPPPGYSYGYVGGYVVAYNPATRIVADVIDLVAAASTR